MKKLHKKEEDCIEAWISLIWYNGTSPRIGWIMPEKREPFKRFFAKTIKQYAVVVK